ncbi:MAG: PfkB family carbohydrate kinase [Verrucomicrobia bacterium]|nr:PfkB family carbohydrate kinase [Verrucomicrobiota bacterium]
MKTACPVTIACFGEILWDCLPRGLFLGGAPINVAYHLSRLGVHALPVTAVGRDFLGDEVLRRLATWKMDARFVTRLPRRPTGTVTATLDRAGAATYQISRDVAWDRITVSPALTRLAPPPAAILHGTLALRETANRQALTHLLAVWPQALRAVDLNLRAPFDTRTAVAFALREAQLVKLNDDELFQLTARPRRGARALELAARAFAERHGLSRVCVTAGAQGAALLWEGSWLWEATRPTVVRDTVGAGDAFFGALLAALLVRHVTPAGALASACRHGEFVAARDGATPPYVCDHHGRARDI